MRNSDVYPSFCGCLKMLLFMYIKSFFTISFGICQENYFIYYYHS